MAKTKPAPTASAKGAALAVDEALLRQIATVMSDTGLTEVEVRAGDRSIRLSRQAAAGPSVAWAHAPAAAPAAAAAAAPSPAPAKAGPAAGTVASPMVGTAYLSPEPGKPAFVAVGDSVREGQTLLIIEAMKVMNPIPAPRAGVVRQILVENAKPVEYGEPLMVIE